MTFKRNGRLLTLTAAMLCLVSLLSIAGLVTLGSDLPAEPEIEWAYPWDHDSVPPQMSVRIERLESAATDTEGSMAVRLFASPTSATELQESHAAFRASAAPFDDASSPEQRLALAINDAGKTTEGTVMFVGILFAIAAAAGLLSVLRLRFRGVTFLACGLLALDAAGGISGFFLFDVHPAWVAAATFLSVIGLFGLLIGTNLLPDSNHPMVVSAEEQLRSLPVSKRRIRLVMHVLGGLLLVAVGVIGTIVSYANASPGAYYSAYVGAVASGLIFSALPIIAAARVSAGRSTQ